MRILRGTILFVLLLLNFFAITGCKDNYDEEYWDYRNKFQDVVKFRSDLQDVGKLGKAPNSSIFIEGGYPEEIKVVLDTNLDKCLGSVCENYNLSGENGEIITEEMVREALIDNVVQTAGEYKEQGETHFLYKIFSWCGEFCKDNVVYCGTPQEEEKEMELLNRYKYTNYQTILGQKNMEEKNQTDSFKFKWQQ